MRITYDLRSFVVVLYRYCTGFVKVVFSDVAIFLSSEDKAPLRNVSILRTMVGKKLAKLFALSFFYHH